MNVPTEVVALFEKEAWPILTEGVEKYTIIYGERFPVTHPFRIHAKLYRTQENPEVKLRHLKKMHDYLWGIDKTVWHYWTERLFEAHCEGHKYISLAGGASTGKSDGAARLALLFWLADPAGRACIVASTTLQSLNSRIWGYISAYLHDMELELPFVHSSATPPKILYNKRDLIHGMFAIAAAKGAEGKERSGAIKNYIGRHPKRGLMLVLDECTDLDPAILEALPNLEAGQQFFQTIGIGNSLSKFDLHGALSTPKLGWDSVDPQVDNRWETTQKDGICLFFSCFESPAIHETDMERKKKLSRFLITTEQIEEKKALYGEKSDAFYRFVLGYWQDESVDPVVITDKFMANFNVSGHSEWGGITPLYTVGGLDLAFSQGGDKCILQLGVMGADIEGRRVLDFRDRRLTHVLPIRAALQVSAEIQIADQVLDILARNNMTLDMLALDACGQGRAFAEVLRLRAGSDVAPFKIYSVRAGYKNVNSFDMVIKTPYELWTELRSFIETNQIRGMPGVALRQLTSRLVVFKQGKPALEKKSDYKIRMGAISPSMAHSPDEADACALTLQAALLRFGFQRASYEVRGLLSMHDEKMMVHDMQKKEITMKEQRHVEIGSGFNGDLYDMVQNIKSDPFA